MSNASLPVLAWQPPKPSHYRRLSYATVVGPAGPVRHALHGPVLDQGQVGACTGNDAVDCLRCDPLWRAIASGYNERTAQGVYHTATTLDGLGRPWPPNDRGSSNTAAAEAAIRLKLATGASRCADFPHFLATLAAQPVMFASNWYDGFDTPDASGLVVPTGSVRGGHSYAAVGIDPSNELVWFLNSWAASWGVGGYFAMSYGTVRALIAQENEMVALHTSPGAPQVRRPWWSRFV